MIPRISAVDERIAEVKDGSVLVRSEDVRNGEFSRKPSEDPTYSKRRSFTQQETDYAWNNANTLAGMDADNHRADEFGNIINYYSRGTNDPMGWDLDHSKPFADGGTHPNNLQAIQSEENRVKKNSTYSAEPVRVTHNDFIQFHSENSQMYGTRICPNGHEINDDLDCAYCPECESYENDWVQGQPPVTYSDLEDESEVKESIDDFKREYEKEKENRREKTRYRRLQKPLVFATWNIWRLGKKPNENKPRDAKVLARFLNLAQIAVIQEISKPDGDEVLEVLEALEALEVEHFSRFTEIPTGPRRSTTPDYYAALWKGEPLSIKLSQCKLISENARTTEADDFRYVPAYFKFEVKEENSFRIGVISVHLSPEDSQSAQRLLEFRALAAWIKDHENEVDLWIVAGDTNVRNGQEAEEVVVDLKKKLPDHEIRHMNEGHNNTNNPLAKKRKPFDQIFVIYSKKFKVGLTFFPFKVEEIEELIDESSTEYRSRLSDHCPCYIRIDILVEEDLEVTQERFSHFN
jgi:hypothetical protein